MLSRRLMIRALGFGAPAAAVAAAVGLPESAGPGPVFATGKKLSLSEADALSVNWGHIVASDLRKRGPVAREMERTYGLRRSLA